MLASHCPDLVTFSHSAPGKLSYASQEEKLLATKDLEDADWIGGLTAVFAVYYFFPLLKVKNLTYGG